MKLRLVFLSVVVIAIAAAGLTAQGSPKDVDSRLARLEAQVQFLQHILFRRSPKVVAELHCDTAAYAEVAPVESALSLLIACERLEPYLEGYRLSIAVANPHNLAFGGFRATIAYGEDASKALTKTVSLASAELLRPGLWNRMTVVINPATVRELRAIEISEVRMTSAR